MSRGCAGGGKEGRPQCALALGQDVARAGEVGWSRVSRVDRRIRRGVTAGMDNYLSVLGGHRGLRVLVASLDGRVGGVGNDGCTVCAVRGGLFALVLAWESVSGGELCDVLSYWEVNNGWFAKSTCSARDKKQDENRANSGRQGKPHTLEFCICPSFTTDGEETTHSVRCPGSEQAFHHR